MSHFTLNPLSLSSPIGLYNIRNAPKGLQKSTGDEHPYTEDEFNPAETCDMFTPEVDGCTYHPKQDIVELSQKYVDRQGNEIEEFACLKSSFFLIAGGVERTYTSVSWAPDLRKRASERGPRTWTNSLKFYGQRDNGLWLNEIKETKKGLENETQLISDTPTVIECLVQDDEQQWVSLLMYLEDETGYSWKPINIALKSFMQEASSLSSPFAELKGKGVVFIDEPKKPRGTFLFHRMITDYQRSEAKRMKVGRSQAGWHELQNPDGATKMVFIGNGYSNDAMPYTGPRTHSFSSKGNETAYMRKMANVLKENPHVAIIAGFAQAGSLVEFIDQQDHSPIFALIGESSTGKSLAAQLALSFRGYHRDLILTFNATPNAIGAAIRSFNSTNCVVDEIGSNSNRMTDEERAAQIYTWASGEDKQRLSKNGFGGYAPKVTQKSHYTLLLTGEKGLINIANTPTGNKVRMTQLLWTDENPLWHGIKNQNEAEELRAFIDKNYGWMFPRATQEIAVNLEQYKGNFGKFSSILQKETTSQQAGRKSNTWALSMTGLSVLMDAFTTYSDEHLGGEPLFTKVDFMKVFGFCKKLMVRELDSMPVKGEDEMYFDFLHAIPTLFAADIHNGANEVRGNSYGQYEYKKPNHTLDLIASKFEKVCASSGVDSGRFIEWAKGKGLLKLSSEGKSQVSVRVAGNPPCKCYKLRWTEE